MADVLTSRASVAAGVMDRSHVLTRRFVAIGLVLVGSLLLPAAHADAPERQGWWYGESELGALGGLLTGLRSADVADDGLLVQGGSANPAAYAALTFPVGSASLASPLRLVPDPSAASVPASEIEACPLDDPAFAPAQGGAPEDAPAYDCLGAVSATVVDDGSYVIDVTTLRRGDVVAIALLPATPSTRVVFAAPGDDALSVGAPASTGSGPSQSARPPSAPTPVDATGPLSSPDPGRATPAVDAVPRPAASPDAAGPAPALPDGVFRGPSAQSVSSNRPTGPAIVFGLVAALGAGLWFAAGQLGVARSRQPTA